MDAIVTARVPVEIKEQGNKILKSIGATPTQLINSAYSFLLAEKKLPQANSHAKNDISRKRKLSKSQIEQLKKTMAIMNLGPAVYSQDDFKTTLNAARDERYAHTA